ncbi:MAG TPA: glycosyltransferase family 4 protein [Candidatus Nitrosotalea sp.]|jgi:glycosyltransferase involved in cell wall biosynthesis|nr:glycosyltransferase family 4 protein [Candidatus Nitrosotalea sp.]
MRVGLLPALGGGIRALAQTGQQSRLIDGYFRPYLRAFDGLDYFSYLPESLAEYTDDAELCERVRVLAPTGSTARGRRAVQIPFAHAAEMRRCAALRVFQITGVIPALIARRRFGIPYVTSYGFWYGALSQPGPKRVLKVFVERLGLRHAAAVIATTPELAERASRLARRVELIPNGVDTTLFRPVRPPENKPKRILYVGRLSEEKNLGAIVTATGYVGDRVMAVMVGSGHLRGPLESQAKELGVVVEFPGVVDQRRLPAVYGSADAFVLASFTEGHPKVLLEAMACGVPCVASDCAGNRSLVTDGRTGLLFDPHQPKQLAACLERLLTEPGLGPRLAETARAEIVARYDLRALVEREVALVRRVAGGGG